MKVYRTRDSLFVEHEARYYKIEGKSFDELVGEDEAFEYLTEAIQRSSALSSLNGAVFLAPIGNQEVWAAGVTYYRSRDARIEESKDAGGGDFYDRVYAAERPELFFKSVPQKVVGPGRQVKIRSDATWSVPEPELVLLVNAKAEIIGYTIGNDMSSRDIEGQNPLYLPQAKIYDDSCALGPCVVIQKEPFADSSAIQMEILRDGNVVFTGVTALTELKRSPRTLVEYLFRDHSFPHGCYLLTGTGIIPPDEFTLHRNDEIRISIDGIGTLTNTVA